MTGKSAEDLKVALEQFNDARGGVPMSLREYLKELRNTRKQIIDALKTGPLSVPEISTRTGVETELVLWHIAAMRKYGQVREAEPNGSYMKYSLMRS